jgi:ADP-ribose pyrophosphatase YjhB (NUDIX family)
MRPTRDFSCVVFAIGPGNMTPLVKEPTKPKPHYWKLPGGKCEEGETPRQTAVREFFEETGLRIKEEWLILIATVEINKYGKKYTLYYFRVILYSFMFLNERGNEGEVVGMFHTDTLKTLPDFMPSHCEQLLKAGLL